MDTKPPKNESSTEIPLREVKKYFEKKRISGKLIGIILLLVLIPLIFFLVKNQSFFGPNKKTSTEVAFGLSESYPAKNMSEIKITTQPMLVFSQKLQVQEKDIEKYIHMSPRPKGSWHLEKNGQVVYFTPDTKASDTFPKVLSFDTLYTITVDKTLGSVKGKNLKENAVVRFRTEEDPRFGITTEFKLLSVAPNQPIKMYLYNAYNPTDGTASQNVTVTVHKASLDQLLTYFTAEGSDDLHSYPFTKTDINTILKTFTSNIQTDPAISAKFLSLQSINQPGVYYVNIKNDFGSEDLFVTVSNHVAAVFTDKASFTLWAAKSQSGQHLSGISIDAYSLKGKPQKLFSGVTNENGFYTNNRRKDINLFVTKQGQEVAAIQPYFSEDYDSRYPTVFSYADRPLYRPGDTVHFKAVLRKQENGSYTIPKTTVYLQYISGYNASSNKKYIPLEVDDSGTVAYDVILPKASTEEYGTIYLSVKEKDSYKTISTLPVHIQSYRKPDIEVTATTEEKEYISKDTSHITLYATTLYGKPLKNIPFTYRILVTPMGESRDRANENFSAYTDYGYGQDLTSGEGVFDSKGKARLTVSTDLGKLEESQLATIEVTPQIGASPSIGKVTRLIHRGEFGLFFSDVKVEEKETTSKQVTGTVDVLDHSTTRQPVTDQAVTFSLYKVPSYDHKELVTTKDGTPSATGTIPFSFETTTDGQYEVLVQGNDKRGNTVTVKTNVYVGNVENLYAQKPKYSVTADVEKDLYRVNETANVTLSANFPMDEAVIVQTATGGSYGDIITTQTATLQGTKDTYSIPIKSEYSGMLSLNFYIVHDGYLVSTHADIRIKQESKNLVTKLSFNKQVVKPGDMIEATITTEDEQGQPVSADTSLAVIDSAIFQIGYENTNIQAAFYNTVSYGSYGSVYSSLVGIRNSTRTGGGGGGGCFLEGTPITLADGTKKAIEQIAVGDRILTREGPLSNTLVTDSVTKVHRHVVSEYLTINDILHITPVHRILINNKWDTASTITLGDRLLGEDGKPIIVRSIVRHTGSFKVYNLTTKTFHTFLASGVYVHNDKGAEPRRSFVDTAYWNPHIKTDGSGKASVSFKVPDNTTTFTGIVYANTKNSLFGQTTQSFVSKKDIVIIPGVPNFFYQEDKPVLSTLIQNGTNTSRTLQVTVNIKELSFKKSTTVSIGSGDIEEVSFPVSLSSSTKPITITFEAKEGNTTMDSVLLTRTVLPKGRITSHIFTLTDSESVNLRATYPDLDFNEISVAIAQHPAQNLVGEVYDLSEDVNVGSRLYTAAYLLAKTRDGAINPAIYHYAETRGLFQNAVEYLLKNKESTDKSVSWTPPYPDEREGDPTYKATLWIYAGLQEAQKLGLLDSLTNTQKVINQARTFLKEDRGTRYPAESLLSSWILNENHRVNTPSDTAVDVLKGKPGSLQKLKTQALPTTTDRYVWFDQADFEKLLPTLAMIEKGTREDADKAIKGLSIATQDGYYVYDSQFLLLIGLKHAIKNGLLIDQGRVTLSINDEEVYEQNTKERAFLNHRTSVALKNLKDGKARIAVEKTEGSLPLYTTILMTDYAPSDTSLGIFERQHVTERIFKGSMERTYFDLTTKERVSTVQTGTSGLTMLSLQKPFGPVYHSDRNSYDTYAMQFRLIDGLSPAAMYLNQTSGNSPQYNTAFSDITREFSNAASFSPINYSDQALFFTDRVADKKQILLTYPFYKISDGSYYQPKTSIAFPKLGIIVDEK